MAESAKLNILIETGADFILPFTVYDDDHMPVDLTDSTIESHLRESASSSTYYEFTCTNNGKGGRIIITMPNEVTSQIGFTRGVYDVKVTTVNGTVYVVNGDVTIRQGVTRPFDGTFLNILGFSSRDDFPELGKSNRLYFTYDLKEYYRWNGLNYVLVGNAEKTSPTVEGPHDITRAYDRLSIVSANGISYISRIDVPAGTPLTDTDYWMPLTDDEAAAGAAAEAAEDARNAVSYIAEVFDRTKNYVIGDYAIWNGNLYRFTTDHDAGEWDAEDAEQITVGEEFQNVHSRIDAEVLKLQLAEGNVYYYFPYFYETGSAVQGCCALVVTPTKTIMFDAGYSGTGSTNGLWPCIKAYFDDLVDRGILTNIDYIVISHYHPDHVLCLDKILEEYPHENCTAYIPLDPSNYEEAAEAIVTRYGWVKSTLESADVDYVEVNQDMTINLGDNLDVSLYNSTMDDYDYYNDNLSNVGYNTFSMVALFRHGDTYSMFPGDLDKLGASRYIENHPLPKLFLLCLNHHGYSGSDGLYNFWTKADPEFVVIPQAYEANAGDSLYGLYGKYFNRAILVSQAYSDAVLVSSKSGGSLISGKILSNPSVLDDKKRTIYVNNEYDGTDGDGSSLKPFKKISDAVRFANDGTEIMITGTATPYSEDVYFSNKFGIAITGVEVDNVRPTLSGMLTFEGCYNINISKLIFDSTNANQLRLTKSSTANVQSCKFQGNISTSDAMSVTVSGGFARVNYCGFTDCNIALRVTYGGVIQTEYNTYNNVNYPYSSVAGQIDIIQNETYTQVNTKLIEATTRTKPLFIRKENITSTLLSKIDADTISLPLYYDSTHPVCVVSNKKLYDLLTGQEVTVS